jgi:2-polyprenyl-6-methoxyphenol hydroxylase-like FAD-dependent oxidoreductase
MENFDVIVAGAGPVGLMLACELELVGASVAVIERRDEMDPTIKAGGIGPLAAEALERRGFGPAIREAEAELARGMAAMAAQAAARPAAAQARPAGPPLQGVIGHFSGLFLLEARHQREPERRQAGVNQQAVERMLGARARELGVAVRRGYELVELEPTDRGVTVEVRRGGAVEILQAGWLVGCDGGRSLVRKRAGFEFPGTEPTLTGYQALVELDDGDKLLPLGWRRTPRGMLAYGPIPGRILVVEFDGAPAERDAPITRDELQAALRRVSGTDVSIRAISTATRWTDNARVATDYRRGRVLLAGDAAHVHSPFGGQGLNLGLVDAANLGWKLAAELAGWAPPGLLDSYTAERRPVALRVVENTRAQVALMRPDPQTTALRELFATLLGQPAVNAHVGGMMRGLEERYPIAGDHPLTGAPLPALALDRGSSAELFAAGDGVLLDLGAGAPELRRPRLRTVRATCAARPELRAALVRPDGYVAWASDGGLAGLAEAVDAWFGRGDGRA